MNKKMISLNQLIKNELESILNNDNLGAIIPKIDINITKNITGLHEFVFIGINSWYFLYLAILFAALLIDHYWYLSIS